MESGVGCLWLAGENHDWGGREGHCGRLRVLNSLRGLTVVLRPWEPLQELRNEEGREIAQSRSGPCLVLGPAHHKLVGTR